MVVDSRCRDSFTKLVGAVQMLSRGEGLAFRV